MRKILVCLIVLLAIGMLLGCADKRTPDQKQKAAEMQQELIKTTWGDLVVMGGSGRIKAVASFNNEKKIKLCDGLGGAPMGPYTVEQIANQTTLVIRDGNPEYPRYAAMFLTQHKRDLPRKDELPK